MKDADSDRLQKIRKKTTRTQVESIFSVRKGLKDRAFYVDLKMMRGLGEEEGIGAPTSSKPHLLARIFADRIETWPIGSNASQTYSAPREGKPYPCVIYRLPRPYVGDLPPDPAAAVSHVERVFDPRLFNSCASGLGLRPFLDQVLKALHLDSNIDTIEINYSGEVSKRANVIFISETTLDNIRKEFNRADSFWRRQMDGSKSALIYEDIVEKLNPSLVVPDTPTPHFFTRMGGTPRLHLEKFENQIKHLPRGLPVDLKPFRKTMEWSALYRVIYYYQMMLSENLEIPEWKSFLEENLDFVVKCFQHPRCTVLEPVLASQSGSGAEGPIICGHESLVLTVRSPEATLMMRDESGAWRCHLDLASAIDDGRKLRLEVKRQIQAYRTVVVAGMLPTDPEEASAYATYKAAVKKYYEVDLVDFSTLLNGLRSLAAMMRQSISPS